ncbi:hypothetical protein PS004_23555, partial [Shigella sonnei]|nr:hypothetical protein [Shigella sonnei]
NNGSDWETTKTSLIARVSINSGSQVNVSADSSLTSDTVQSDGVRSQRRICTHVTLAINSGSQVNVRTAVDRHGVDQQRVSGEPDSSR